MVLPHNVSRTTLIGKIWPVTEWEHPEQLHTSYRQNTVKFCLFMVLIKPYFDKKKLVTD